jgi:hypothetical protein
MLREYAQPRGGVQTRLFDEKVLVEDKYPVGRAVKEVNKRL